MAFFDKALVRACACSLLAAACTTHSDREGAGTQDALPRSQAERIIDASIAFHGGDLYNDAELGFDLDGQSYRVARVDDSYRYTAHDKNAGREVYRELNNLGYFEHLNGKMLELSAEDSSSQAGDIHASVYFALLPFSLDDPQLQAEYLGEDSLDGRAYHRLGIRNEDGFGLQGSFAEFLYWFDTESFRLDYLAHSLAAKEGTRFRKALNSRRVNGIVFQDYEVFRGPGIDSLHMIAELYASDRLLSISRKTLSGIFVKAQYEFKE